MHSAGLASPGWTGANDAADAPRDGRYACPTSSTLRSTATPLITVPTSVMSCGRRWPGSSTIAAPPSALCSTAGRNRVVEALV